MTGDQHDDGDLNSAQLADAQTAAADAEAREEAQQRQVDRAMVAMDQMGQVVDDLQDYVVTAAERDQHATGYRINLLWVHAGAALLMAPLLIATGPDGITGPSFRFLRTLPGSPYSLASILGVGGLVLGMGCIFRAKRTEMVGLVLLALFYITLAVSFAVPPINWLTSDRSMAKPPMYGPVLYGHLTTIMAVHIGGLVNVLRDAANVAAIRTRRADRRPGAGGAR